MMFLPRLWLLLHLSGLIFFSLLSSICCSSPASSSNSFISASGTTGLAVESRLIGPTVCRRVFSTQLTSLAEGRGSSKVKKKGRLLLSLLLGLKVLGFSLTIPLVITLALYSAWKGVTISLLAFLIASIVGLKSLFGRGGDPGSQNVIVAKIPGGLAGGGLSGLDFGSSLPLAYRNFNLQSF